MSIMRRVKHLLINSALCSLYSTLVMPYLNYCCDIWGNTYKSRTLLLLLLLAAPTWLWGRCCRHNSPQASSVMDFVFRRSDGSHVSIDTAHPSLIRSSSFSSSMWYHLQSLSSDVFLVSSLYVAKPPQYCFPAPLCYVLYFEFLPDVILSYMVS